MLTETDDLEENESLAIKMHQGGQGKDVTSSATVYKQSRFTAPRSFWSYVFRTLMTDFGLLWGAILQDKFKDKLFLITAA
jgi:hypothetical protein